jgi:hypothetical protein
LSFFFSKEKEKDKKNKKKERGSWHGMLYAKLTLAFSSLQCAMASTQQPLPYSFHPHRHSGSTTLEVTRHDNASHSFLRKRNIRERAKTIARNLNPTVEKKKKRKTASHFSFLVGKFCFVFLVGGFSSAYTVYVCVSSGNHLYSR